MDEVERRTQDATQGLRDSLFTQMTRGIFKDLVTTWTALGSFTRLRLAVEPDVLYRAWCPIIAEDVAEALALHPDVKPSKAGVREHLEMMEGAWKRQIGDTDDA
jgi:hypothetical protein